jgi:two-component system, OmpR family, phosphate regulon sensor histidine kinase PhoR
VFRSRFFWKLYAGYVAVILLSTAGAGWLVARRLVRDSESELVDALRGKVALLREIARPWLLQGERNGLEPRIRALGREVGVRLTVIASDGIVLADSEEEPARMDNHGTRPEVEGARANGEGVAERMSVTLGARQKYLALAVLEEGRAIGFVRASLPMTQIDARLAHLRWSVLFAGLGASAGAILVALFVTRRLAERLRPMTLLADDVARGEYGRLVTPEGQDEIASLARALNSMAEQLRERMETIVRDRNKLLAILSSMVEGVVAVDGDERVLHMNEVAARLLQASPTQSLGRRVWEVTRVSQVSQILEAARTELAERTAELRLQSPTGEILIELRASPLRNASGAPAGAVVVLHDLTELRRLEVVRRDFVANVSHELKTPLTAIRGMVETLLDDRGMVDATRRHFLERIRSQASRLSTLVSDLLTLARVEAQGGVLELRSIDLRGPLREAVARIALECVEKGLALQTDLPAQPLAARAEEEAVRQILDNLLDNALHYTPSGGRIVVRLTGSGSEAAPEAVIEVADTGIGIEPRDQQRIFERFYRVDKARSRELGGTGLGLSIVKHIALSMGGRVGVESTLGKGSTFRVHLPMDPTRDLNPPAGFIAS